MNLLKEFGLFGGPSSSDEPANDVEDFDDEETEPSNVVEIDVRSHRAQGGENIQKVFTLMKERHKAARDPLVDAVTELQIEIAQEDGTIKEADDFNIETADESLTRDELTEKLLELETKARIAKQIKSKKERELAGVNSQIDQLDQSSERAKSYLLDVCTKVAQARRAAVVMLSQNDMAELKLNQGRAVSELNMIARCGDLLLTNSEDPEVATAALNEICAINIKPDARQLYWDVLSPRMRNENSQLDPNGDNNNE